MKEIMEAVPSSAGDISAPVKWAGVCRHNEDCSSESVVDMQRGQLFWLTHVIQQFDKKAHTHIIKYLERA